MRDRRLWRWVRRYAPAEAAAVIGAVLGALLGVRLAGVGGAAVGGDVGEGVAFYAVVIARELRAERSATRPRSRRRLLADLLSEFGPAEALDSFAVRPLAMYAGQYATGDLVIGTLLGKVVADVAFYTIAAASYERHRAPPVGDPFAPAALDAARHPTPYLLMDLDRVVHAYRRLAAALPVDALHYPTTCDAEPGVLAALHRAGCRFTVGSYAELALLRRVGVRPVNVLFGNPVKPPADVARAHRAGCRRFTVDSAAELDKIVEHAPGAAVYVRLRRIDVGGIRDGGIRDGGIGDGRIGDGGVGVTPAEAGDLLPAAAARGLRPLRRRLLRRPARDVSIGVERGYRRGRGTGHRAGRPRPAPGDDRHRRRVPGRVRRGRAVPGVQPREIGRALDRLPYRMHVVAEPGRALVAEAGVLVATVLGRARRGDREWVHLDVGAPVAGDRHPLSDSRRRVSDRCHLTGPGSDGRDTVLPDVALSADLTGCDRVYIGGAGARSTAGAHRPPVVCVGPTERSVRPAPFATVSTRSAA